MPRFVTLLACLAALTLPRTSASAQPPPAGPAAAAAADADRLRQAVATLPESNETIILSVRVEDAIRAGDYRLAVELIGKLRSLPGELVAAPASRTFHPIWRQTQRLLAQLPEAGLQVYRRLSDAEVRARFEQARGRGDLAELWSLFRAFPLTQDWVAVGMELAALLLDRGDSHGAIEVLRDLLASPAAPVQARALLAVAQARVGAIESARRLLSEYRADPAALAQPGSQAKLEELQAWLEHARAARFADPAGPAPLAPRLDARGLWGEPLLSIEADDDALHDDESDVLSGIDLLRRVPLLEPILHDGRLIVRAGGWTVVLDAWTLAPRWRARELGPADADEAETRQRGRGAEPVVSPATRDLLHNHLKHVVAAAFGQVYSIEPARITDFAPNFAAGRFQVFPDAPTDRNELVARDLATGAVRWRSASDATGPLFNVSFQDRPIAVGEQLVAPIRRESDLKLAVLDPATGRLVREVPVVGPPTHFESTGGRALLTVDETTLFVCTGNGVVAALRRDDFSWRWAATYPSTLVQHLGNRMWWQPPDAPQESTVDRPQLVEDLLILAPIDSSDIFALDRFSGREVWRMPRREHWLMIGACDAGLLVGGQQISCLDAADPEGKPIRWRSVPLSMTGRPAVRGPRVFVPTRDGIAVLDTRTGKLLAGTLSAADAAAPAASRPEAAERAEPRAVAQRLTGIEPQRVGNLLAGSDALFCVSRAGVSKLPDLDRTARDVRQLEGLEDGPARYAMVLAWTDLLTGSFRAGIDRLRDLVPADPSLGSARDRLMTQLFLEIARAAPVGEDRLEWLQRAAGLSAGGAAAARLTMIIGTALEEAQRWDEALNHYLRAIAEPESRLASHPRDVQLRLADRLFAASRLPVVVEQLSSSAVEARVSRWIDELKPDGAPEAMLRLWSAVGDGPLRERIAAAPALRRLPAELAVRVLPRTLPPDLSDESRAQLLLARWDADVSIADLAAADGWAAEWDRTAAAKPADPESATARLLRQIEAARTKLATHRGPAFTAEFPRFDRLWRSAHTELVFDESAPLSMMRPWSLVRTWDASRNELQLISTLKSGLAWRQTHDGMTHADAVRSAALDALDAHEAFEHLAAGDPDDLRTVWPMTVFDEFAVVPVRGGVVCVGRGPLRSGGRRLWELAVPGWREIGRDVAPRMVGSPAGLAISPRADRVQLIDWADGRVCWQRDLPGAAVQRLFSVGAFIVVHTADDKLWAMDARTGMGLVRVAEDRAPPRFVTVVADRLVLGLREAVIGLNPISLDLDWTRTLADSDIFAVIHGSEWLAIGNRNRDQWHVLDARTGKLAFDASIGAWKYIPVAAFDGHRILLVSPSGTEPGSGGAPVMTLAAIDPLTGGKLWQSEIATRSDWNATQLLAHPRYVAALIDTERTDTGPRRRGQRNTPPDAEPPVAIRLLNKETGETDVSYPIFDKFEPAASFACRSFLLVTPQRMVVQIAGNLLAFGDNPPEAGD